jgi:hypothetical protein
MPNNLLQFWYIGHNYSPLRRLTGGMMQTVFGGYQQRLDGLYWTRTQSALLRMPVGRAWSAMNTCGTLQACPTNNAICSCAQYIYRYGAGYQGTVKRGVGLDDGIGGEFDPCADSSFQRCRALLDQRHGSRGSSKRDYTEFRAEGPEVALK